MKSKYRTLLQAKGDELCALFRYRKPKEGLAIRVRPKGYPGTEKFQNAPLQLDYIQHPLI